MYAVYSYSASSTLSNIISDVIAILTGETNKANLSANCDQTNTSIDASVSVAGWSVYDASAGTNAQCLRAVVADNASQYKYMVLDFNSSGYLLQKTYETWDSGAHTGTNMCQYSNSTSYCQRLNITSGGYLYITASVRHCLMYSYQNSVWGSTTGATWSGVFERTRRSPWDTVANGYPPFVWINGFTSTVYEPRSVNSSGTDITTSSTVMDIVHALISPTSNVPPNGTVPIDSSKNLGHLMLPFGVIKTLNGHMGGDITSLTDIWQTTQTYGSTNDTIVYSGNTYVIWAMGNSARIAIRKG